MMLGSLTNLCYIHSAGSLNLFHFKSSNLFCTNRSRKASIGIYAGLYCCFFKRYDILTLMSAGKPQLKELMTDDQNNPHDYSIYYISCRNHFDGFRHLTGRTSFDISKGYCCLS